MKLEYDYLEDTIVLRPIGRIDSATSQEFSDELNKVLEVMDKDDDKDYLFDFKDVEYISSSGLRVFLSLKKKNKDKNIIFKHVNSTVYEVFDLTGFTDMFPITKENPLDNPDIKAIFFDVDGTLLSHKLGAIPQSTIDALNEVQVNGVKLVIATGRDLVELKKLPIDVIDFDAYLTLNGNICLDKDKKMFAGNAIADEEIEILVNIFKAGRIPFVLIGENSRYINYVDDVVINTQLETHGTIPDIGEYKGEKIYQCLSFVDNEMRQKLNDMLDQCVITSWNQTGIDIIAKTGGKDAGIQQFLDKENIKRSQSMAFGDGENDIKMIRYVGIGVAMGNGTEALKHRADYITTSVDDDGIANALKHFGLIDR